MGARLVIGLAVAAVIAFLLWDRDQLLDQLAVARSNVQALQGAVEAQNDAIQLWQTKAEAFEAQATIRARHALQQRPPLPTGHGPAAMNAWLRETFTPTLFPPGRADPPRARSTAPMSTGHRRLLRLSPRRGGGDSLGDADGPAP